MIRKQPVAFLVLPLISNSREIKSVIGGKSSHAITKLAKKTYKMKTVILNWYGPYDDLALDDEKEFGNGLYLITGKKRYERVEEIQYCGITKNSFRSRFLKHHKKNIVTTERKYWLAEVEYPTKVNRDTLEMTEKLIIYFWQPSLNERKKVSLPKNTTVISRWFTVNGEPRINQKKIYKELSDVISWDGDFWRTGNLKLYEN